MELLSADAARKIAAIFNERDFDLETIIDGIKVAAKEGKTVYHLKILDRKLSNTLIGKLKDLGYQIPPPYNSIFWT